MNLPIIKGVEPLVGWRGYEPLKPHFLSCLGQVLVPRQLNEASCGNGLEHEDAISPGFSCSCGFYAFKTADELVKQSSYSNQKVMAEVLMWGRVIEHERGFKAQYCYPKHLYVMDKQWQPLAPYLGFIYGVPAEVGCPPMEAERARVKAEEVARKAEVLRLKGLSKVQKMQETKARNRLLEERAKKLGLWKEIDEEIKVKMAEQLGVDRKTLG